MSKNLITVWNASSGVLKIGATKFLLKPAQALEVERDTTINKLIDAGKLVVIAFAAEETPAKDEQSSRKKSKKDSSQEELKEDSEIQTSETNGNQEQIESLSSSEDSILSEEPA